MASIRTEHQALTRNRVMDAGGKLFAVHGFGGTSVAMIAEQAGVTTGAIYSNFEGKLDLFAAVVERRMVRQAEDYRALYSGGDTPAERLQSGADRWMEMIEDEPEYFPLFVEVWRVSLRDEGVRERLRGAYRDLIRELASLIREGSTEAWPEMDDEAVEAFASIICALADGIALGRMLDPERIPKDLFGNFLRLVAESVPPPAGRS